MFDNVIENNSLQHTLNMSSNELILKAKKDIFMLEVEKFGTKLFDVEEKCYWGNRFFQDGRNECRKAKMNLFMHTFSTLYDVDLTNIKNVIE